MLTSVSPGLRRTLLATAALCAVVLALFAFSASAYANDYVVNDDGVGSACTLGTATHATIQAAVDAAAVSNDVIKICNGNYLEAIELGTKNITLVGESEAGVLLSTTPAASYGLHGSGAVVLKLMTFVGPHASYGVKIDGVASSAVLEDITVKNSKRTNLDFNGSSSVSLRRVKSYDAAAGVGIAFSDVGTVVAEDITTARNAWGGMAVYVRRAVNPTPVASVELKGTLALGETLPFYVGLDPNPANTYYSVDLLKLNGLLPYMVTGWESAETVFAFVPTQAAADTLRTQMLARYENVSTPTQVTFDADDRVRIVGNTSTISAALAWADPGDTIAVGAGTFAENLVVNEHVRLIGIGNGVDPIKDTVIKAPALSPSAILTVGANGAGAGNPILFKQLHLSPIAQDGFVLNASTFVKLDAVKVIGDSTTENDSARERCLLVPGGYTVSGLDVVDSAFESCDYGWWIAKHETGLCTDYTTLTAVSMLRTSVSYNSFKGLYFEKLDNAVFADSSFHGNGSGLVAGASTTNAAIDVNLKNGAYTNLQFNNLAVTNNGVGYLQGAGLWIKGRDDWRAGNGQYATCPGTLTNVTVTGGVYVGNQRGIVVGEFKQLPLTSDPMLTTTLTSGPVVTISGAGIYDNVPQGTLSFAHGDIVNYSQSPITATGNWWGEACGPYNASSCPDGAIINAYSSTWHPTATIDASGHSTTKLPTLNALSFDATPKLLSATATTVDIPVLLAPFATAVADLDFSVTYPACLDFDSVQGLSSTYIINASENAVAGQVHVTVHDNSVPQAAMAGGKVLALRFNLGGCGEPALNAASFAFTGSPVVCGDVWSNEMACSAAGATAISIDRNELPTALVLDGGIIDTLAENSAPLATVGILTLTDSDGNPANYSMEPDAVAKCGAGTYNNEFFTISDDTVQAVKKFDYETLPNSYFICVKADDGRSGNVYLYQALQINITDVPETTPTLVVGTDPTYGYVIRKGSPNQLQLPITFTPNGANIGYMTFKVTYNPACLAFDNDPVTPGFVNESPSGTLNFAFNAPPPIAGVISTLKFDDVGSCPGLRTDVPIAITNVVAQDGSSPVAINATGQTVIVIADGMRGDCNSTGTVNAADLTADVLEIFDSADGSNTPGSPFMAWLNAPYSYYKGNPIGCDANANGYNEAADISCTVLVVFGIPAGCTDPDPGLVLPASAIGAVLAMPGSVAANGAVQLPIALRPMGNQVAALSFSLYFDPAKVSFDPTDANGDGLPDALAIHATGNLLKVAIYDAETHLLNVAIAAVSVPMPAFSEGNIATVTVNSSAGGLEAVRMYDASAGSVAGDEVPVTVYLGENEVRQSSNVFLPAVR